MIFICGTRLYGRVDQVPSQFYVATEFVHMWYIPLIPLRTFLIVEGWQSEEAIKIPMSFKSVLTAYVRAALILAALVLFFKAGLLWYSGHEAQGSDVLSGVFQIATGVLCLLACWSSHRLSRADEQKARALAHYL